MMKCEHCQSNLEIATIFHSSGNGLIAQPGYECRHCGALYDQNGTQLEPPFSQRDNEEDEDE